MFPAKYVYQVFAGNADKRHRGGVSGALSTQPPAVAVVCNWLPNRFRLPKSHLHKNGVSSVYETSWDKIECFVLSNFTNLSRRTPLKVEGECYCGAIGYEADVQPGTISVCHCDDCQTHSGSAFRANISATAESFRMVKGVPRTYVKTSASGAKRFLAFCDNCGTPLYACAVENPATYSLRIGTLKQRHELGLPMRQIWEKRHLHWVKLAENMDIFQGQP